MGGIPYQSTVSDLALDANALSFAAAALGLALSASALAFAASALVTLTTLDLSREIEPVVG